MTNKEIALEIFSQVEKKHCNLYFAISKEDFQVELNKFLNNCDDLDDIHFDAGMLRLFALFKDAHTQYISNEGNFVEKCIEFIEGKFYYFDVKQGICEEIVKVNGYDFKDVYEKLKALVPYEVETWANCQVERKLMGIKQLMMVDCQNKEDQNKIEYTLKDGEVVTKEYIKREFIPKRNYSFAMMENNVLKIEYRQCRDMEGYPFKQFMCDVTNALDGLPSACLIDLRNNTGGSDVVVRPLLDWLKENCIKTYALMGESTFSGGVVALIDLKSEVNATLIGTDAGQEGHSYGNGKWNEVEGKFFKASKNYINQTTIDTKQGVESKQVKRVVGYLGPIRPDIYLPKNIDDVRMGVDGQLRDALEIIKNDLYQENDVG